jgi:hypothetical protein
VSAPPWTSIGQGLVWARAAAKALGTLDQLVLKSQHLMNPSDPGDFSDEFRQHLMKSSDPGVWRLHQTWVRGARAGLEKGSELADPHPSGEGRCVYL